MYIVYIHFQVHVLDIVNVHKLHNCLQFLSIISTMTYNLISAWDEKKPTGDKKSR